MVQYLNYRGEQLPIRVSYMALEELQKKNEEMLFGSLAFYKTILRPSLVSGHIREKKSFEFTEDQLVDVLEECYLEFVALVPEFFPNLKSGNVLENLPQAQAPTEVKGGTTDLAT